MFLHISKKPWPQVHFIIGGYAYNWRGWFGCQLESREWRRVPAGTTRKMEINNCNYEFRVFNTTREGLKIRTTWTLPLRGDTDEQNAMIRKLKADLRAVI